jgi:hypothetical protein
MQVHCNCYRINGQVCLAMLQQMFGKCSAVTALLDRRGSQVASLTMGFVPPFS